MAVGAADDLPHRLVKRRRGPAIEREFPLAQSNTIIDRTEIQVGKLHGLFQLPGERGAQQDDRNMGSTTGSGPAPSSRSSSLRKKAIASC